MGNENVGTPASAEASAGKRDKPACRQAGDKGQITVQTQQSINACVRERGVIYRLWIDFDAARSIVHKGNGGYSLKPVIRTYTDAISVAISGNVSPDAPNISDTRYSVPLVNGQVTQLDPVAFEQEKGVHFRPGLIPAGLKALARFQ